ncbi:MAG: carboxymuconolactone decarboxylase family protein [Ignavibacteriae bacterium HGW-Ignavibacteriae-2]|jgi:AhpD family alkylhydroperoxidase|nr:carboxymuconolactone decarboxylase family protein [Bacteroidota bacterium]PKL90218.1 MAG: carboxymuconolactone decarboxylase family protein [Ignavibacteriae bacterium HGW-Ignavibacteriae-2]
MSEIPKHFLKFKTEYSEIANAYEELGNVIHGNSKFDQKTRALIKLAISTGAKLEGAVHSHTRKALDAGLTKEEIKEIAILAIPTIGLPSSMAALSWIDDLVEK